MGHLTAAETNYRAAGIGQCKKFLAFTFDVRNLRLFIDCRHPEGLDPLDCHMGKFAPLSSNVVLSRLRIN